MSKNERIEGDKAKEDEGFELLREVFKKNEGIVLERNEDKETQLLGLDYEFDLNGKHRICDDKFATDYINKHLPTFCLELATKPVSGVGDYKKGWFVDKDKITDTYLFKWLDNGKMEAIVVDRRRLTEEIEKMGWTLDELYDYAMKISEGEAPAGYHRGLKFRVSYGKREKGITIILSRQFYRRISDLSRVYDVDDTKIMELCEKYK